MFTLTPTSNSERRTTQSRAEWLLYITSEQAVIANYYIGLETTQSMLNVWL